MFEAPGYTSSEMLKKIEFLSEKVERLEVLLVEKVCTIKLELQFLSEKVERLELELQRSNDTIEEVDAKVEAIRMPVIHMLATKMGIEVA